jgi:hypothetical protein
MPKLNFSHRGENIAARCGVVAAALACCALFVLAAFGMGYGQAGRRVSKPKTDPPVPKAAEAAATPAATPKEAEKVPLLIGSHTASVNLPMSMSAGELLQGAVVQRLRDSQSLQIGSDSNMTRGDAIKRAKNAETKSQIVWLELHHNSSMYDPAGTSGRGTENLYIQYIVYEPGTAKVKAQGNVYLRPTSSSRVPGLGIGRRLPRCYPQGLYGVEFALVEAGIETAERIFREMSLPYPPLCS